MISSLAIFKVEKGRNYSTSEPRPQSILDHSSLRLLPLTFEQGWAHLPHQGSHREQSQAGHAILPKFVDTRESQVTIIKSCLHKWAPLSLNKSERMNNDNKGVLSHGLLDSTILTIFTKLHPKPDNLLKKTTPPSSSSYHHLALERPRGREFRAWGSCSGH